MSNPLKTGNLNRRLAVVRAAAGSDDGFGKVAGALQLLCTRWASVKPVRRREQSEASGTEARAELTAWLRYDSVTKGIRETDKAVLDGRLYELTAAPMQIGNREGIELLLVAGAVGEPIDPSSLDPVP